MTGVDFRILESDGGICVQEDIVWKTTKRKEILMRSGVGRKEQPLK